MTTSFTTATGSERLELARGLGLEPEALIRAFRLMRMSRLLDDREILFQRQKRIFFQISGAGHEAIQVAAGLVSRPGHGLIGEAGSISVGSSKLCRRTR
jgi:2-oxoisovalerate dehydrogenase E1 component